MGVCHRCRFAGLTWTEQKQAYARMAKWLGPEAAKVVGPTCTRCASTILRENIGHAGYKGRVRGAWSRIGRA